MCDLWHKTTTEASEQKRVRPRPEAMSIKENSPVASTQVAAAKKDSRNAAGSLAAHAAIGERPDALGVIARSVAGPVSAHRGRSRTF